MEHILEMPWPPSVNAYWRSVRGRNILSAAGREYRQRAMEAAAGLDTITGRLDVDLLVAPPDRRRRDLDNLPKAVLDALTHAGVYDDDSQIDRLSIERCEPVPDGVVWVRIRQRAPELRRLPTPPAVDALA